ncbi:MAG: hypothetical protein ACD_73C00591G0001 [uncultured bacterium]|nr:MAG: hypothetical protein ACD_73C00591G0001 [uncultured bacterium]
MRLQLKLEDDQLFLSGVFPKPLLLDNLDNRLQQAQNNWDQFLANPVKQPVFVGCEHLRFVPAQISKPFILIEKSPDYYQLLLEHQLIKPHPQAIMVFGDMGFAPFSLNSKFSYSFIEQEMFCLTRNLLPHLTLTALEPEFFFVFSENPKDVYDEYLFRTLKTLAFIHHIHQQNKILYNEIKCRASHEILALHRGKHDQESIASIASFQFLEPITYIDLGYDHTQGNQFRIFNGSHISRELIDDAFIQNNLSAYLERYQLVLNTLAQNKPSLICYRNQSIYGALEDYLLLKPLFDYCGLPTFSFWIDYQGHQFSGFEGGFLHTSSQTEIEHHLCLHALENYHRANHRHFEYFQPSHSIKNTPSISILKNDQLSLDIAIVNTLKIRSFDIEAFNIIFQMITALSDLPINISYFAFFDALRKFYDAPPTPFKHVGFWSHVINFMDYAFYNQVRLFYVRDILKNLGNTFSINVFGAHWPQFIPPQYCQPFTENPEEIYRSSFLTLDLTPLDSYENPNFNPAKVLMAGGLPVAIKPAYKGHTGLSLLDENSFYYFSNATQITTLLTDLKQNPGLRTQCIQTQSEKLISQFGGHQKAEVQTFLKSLQPLKKINMPPLSFTGSPAKDQFILYSTLGFFFELNGYFENALELWKETTQNIKISFVPLLQHAHALAEKHQFVAHKNFFASLL